MRMWAVVVEVVAVAAAECNRPNTVPKIIS